MSGALENLLGTSLPTRDAFGWALVELGQEREDILVLDADIAESCRSAAFHERFPERSFNLGIAEQSMMTTAAGLATTGFTVFACTYAVFASMRACEEVRTFICHPRLNVKIAASHGGLQVSSDGTTHQALEDIAIMRAFANMTVVQPADAYSMGLAVKAVASWPGPVYLRMTRNAVPPIYDESCRFEIGKAITLRSSREDQVTLFATGVMVSKALEAARVLADQGVVARVIDIHTLKPLDRDAILAAVGETGAAVTCEDHTIIGGLGSAVAEVLAEAYPAPIKRIGVRDVYGESGDAEELFVEYGMGVGAIVEAAFEVIDRKALGATRVSP